MNVKCLAAESNPTPAWVQKVSGMSAWFACVDEGCFDVVH